MVSFGLRGNAVLSSSATSAMLPRYLWLEKGISMQVSSAPVKSFVDVSDVAAQLGLHLKRRHSLHLAVKLGQGAVDVVVLDRQRETH